MTDYKPSRVGDSVGCKMLRSIEQINTRPLSTRRNAGHSSNQSFSQLRYRSIASLRPPTPVKQHTINRNMHSSNG